MTEGRYIVPALERGLKLLTLLDRSRTEISPAEAARLLQMPRSSAFRIIQTLEHFALLERVGNHYRLGPGVLRFGFEYVASLPITDIARPVVDRMRDITGLAAQLAIRDGREIVFVVRAMGASAFASNVTVGTRLPAHATAMGRVMLADLSGPQLRELYVGARFEQFTEQSPRTFAELVRLLRDDHARGHATSEARFEAGISAIAAPVRDGTGRVVAAVGVSIPHPRIGPESVRNGLVKQVVSAAADISGRLNYRPANAA